MGNIAWGVPIDTRGEFAGTFLSLLKPYPLLLGVTTLALFMMHGAIYALMKTEGELQAKLRGWITHCMIFFIIGYAVTTMATLLYVPHMASRVRANPWLFSIAIVNMLAIANIPREVHRHRGGVEQPGDPVHRGGGESRGVGGLEVLRPGERAGLHLADRGLDLRGPRDHRGGPCRLPDRHR